MKAIISLIISLACIYNVIAQGQIPRIQEPKAPFPYYTEDISFQNVADSITIQGTLTLPRLNHFMQECKVGTLEERNSLEQTFSPEAMSVILNWVKIKTK